MFKQSNLKHKKKNFKRVGRGTGSGHGKTACRGHKGQRSRAGGTKGRYFEGGQTPLYRRLPKKRGFKNFLFKKVFDVINVSDLAEYNKEISFKDSKKPVKILGNGELKKALAVTAQAFSKTAKEKIEKAGGSVVKC